MTTTDNRAPVGGELEVADGRAELPLWPWTALRPATGMLLDADDFNVLAGNPRGKHMLHNAWLHGSGVVWGLGIRPHGDWEVTIGPGLAIDRLGRELHVEAPHRISFKDVLEQDHDPTCKIREAVVCFVIQFDTCLDQPVPALAAPCDVTRENQEYSRIIERARVVVMRGHPRAPARPYHRVRVLLGLDPLGEGDAPGKEALVARNEVLSTGPRERAREMLEQFRCLAASDAADWTPVDGECDSGLFPVDDSNSGVALGCLHLTIRDQSGCPVITDTRLDCCRDTVMPTTVMQDLVCALTPGMIGAGETAMDTGPQVVPHSIVWGPKSSDFSFKVTADLSPATLTRDAVIVSSLSPAGWIIEDLERRPRYVASERRVHIRLADRPANPLIRVVVGGTGPTPLYGADPLLPLAGVVGERVEAPDQGRDAVLTDENPFYGGATSDEGVEKSAYDE